MPTEIVTRLTAEEIIARAEKREQRLVRVALFWLLIGALVGCAATLLALALRAAAG